MEKIILGIIPARAGSKRVKSKNIRPLCGKPLIAYTIESALKSQTINRVIVSTDSKEIAEIAKGFGAEVPFLRPAELAADNSTELQYHQHALNWLKEHENYEPDLIVNLYPTTPFRKPETIDDAVQAILQEPEADSLRSMRRCSEHPYKMWVASGNMALPFVQTEDENMHTMAYQSLPEVFIQNASIYITKPATVLQKNSTVGSKVVRFVMDEIESLDINSELDLLMADILLRNDFKL